jgi:hypothetical protein
MLAFVGAYHKIIQVETNPKLPFKDSRRRGDWDQKMFRLYQVWAMLKELLTGLDTLKDLLKVEHLKVA